MRRFQLLLITCCCALALFGGALTVMAAQPLTAHGHAAQSANAPGVPQMAAQQAVTPTTGTTATLATPITVAATTLVGRQPFTVSFGDYVADAELTYPLTGTGPFSTVLLIGGAGPLTMDATFCTTETQPAASSIFATLAEFLPQHGYAVARYNKHYVTGTCRSENAEFYTGEDAHVLLADAAQVLSTVRGNPLVDPSRLFVYGWGEGGNLASSLAVSNTDTLAGVILQAPISVGWRDLVLYQFATVQLPYLRSLATDGGVVTSTLGALATGEGGPVAKAVAAYVASPASTAGGAGALNPYFDRNGDGVIQINRELLPRLNAYINQLAKPRGLFANYRALEALPALSEQAPKLTLPVLILQGRNDAYVPELGARLLNMQLVGNPRHLLRSYPELGHTLGTAADPTTDTFGPIDPAPLLDLVQWLDRQPSVKSRQ